MSGYENGTKKLNDTSFLSKVGHGHMMKAHDERDKAGERRKGANGVVWIISARGRWYFGVGF